MNKTIAGILFCSVSLLTSVDFYGGETDFAKTSLSEKVLSSRQNRDIAAQVKKAFEAARNNGEDATKRKKGSGRLLLEELPELGEKIFPHIEPYLNDESADLRREVIYLAMKIGGDKSLDMVALALRNSNPEIQKVASDQLYFYYSQYRRFLPTKKYASPSMYIAYESFSPEKIAANPRLGKALQDSLKAGNNSTATIYLLAHFSGDETISVLKESSAKSAATELNGIVIASKIVLAEFGNHEAIGELIEYANRNDLRMLLFLLSSLDEIKSPEVLASLAKTLDNESDITGGKGTKKPNKKLPNGIWAQGYPERRLCDFAVNSFVQKFALNNVNERPERRISFGLHSTTYRDNQLVEVRELVKQRIADLSAKTK